MKMTALTILLIFVNISFSLTETPEFCLSTQAERCCGSDCATESFKVFMEKFAAAAKDLEQATKKMPKPQSFILSKAKAIIDPTMANINSILMSITSIKLPLAPQIKSIIDIFTKPLQTVSTSTNVFTAISAIINGIVSVSSHIITLFANIASTLPLRNIILSFLSSMHQLGINSIKAFSLK